MLPMLPISHCIG
jgi:hypothetical protein